MTALVSSSLAVQSRIATAVGHQLGKGETGGTLVVETCRDAGLDRGYVVGGVCPSLVVSPSAGAAETAVSILVWMIEHGIADGLVGYWLDTDGTIYVDRVEVVEDRAEALALAAQRGELAVFDAYHMIEVRL